MIHICSSSMYWLATQKRVNGTSRTTSTVANRGVGVVGSQRRWAGRRVALEAVAVSTLDVMG